MYDCPAMVYGAVVGDEIKIRKIRSDHTHSPLTSQEIGLKIPMSQKSIPEKVGEIAYNLSPEGGSCKDIYSFIGGAEYPNSKCPPPFGPLKNHPYDRNKKDPAQYDNILGIYNKLRGDDGTTRAPLMKKFLEGEYMKALAFTFKEQLNYGNFCFLSFFL